MHPSVRYATEEEERVHGPLWDAYAPAEAYTDAHIRELEDTYSDEWLAIGADGVVAHAPDPLELEQHIARLGLTDAALVRFFMPAPDRIYLL